MRLFIAATFPPDILRDVNARVARVRPRVPPAAWVRPESLHLTLAFLGEMDEARVGSIGSSVQQELASVPRFEARIRGCGFFPNPRNARVAWLGVDPEPPFHAAAGAVRRGLAAAGVTLDGTEFRAHLTLCRIKVRWPPACIETYKSLLGSYTSAPFALDSVTLFSSELNPAGAVHTAIHTIGLGLEMENEA